MHILDDPTGLTPLAQDLLRRTGRREPPPEPRLAGDFRWVRERAGRRVPPPVLLLIRREGFEQRYGGLRYLVRGGEPAGAREWVYDLHRDMGADPAGGWYFDWFGERVSSPVGHRVHTDGRAGVTDGSGVFLEIAPSVPALIESHALLDRFSGWERRTGAGTLAAARRLDGLTDVPEASGPTVRWRVSEDLAVQEFQLWAGPPPRPWRAWIWTRGEAARARLARTLARAAADRP
ncbi:hypothetical protein [Kitasatospora saccharophila]